MKRRAVCYPALVSHRSTLILLARPGMQFHTWCKISLIKYLGNYSISQSRISSTKDKAEKHKILSRKDIWIFWKLFDLLVNVDGNMLWSYFYISYVSSLLNFTSCHLSDFKMYGSVRCRLPLKLNNISGNINEGENKRMARPCSKM